MGTFDRLAPDIIVVGGSRFLRDLLIQTLEQTLGTASIRQVPELYDLFVMVNLGHPCWLVFLSEVELAQLPTRYELPLNLISLRESGKETQVQWADGTAKILEDLSLDELLMILRSQSSGDSFLSLRRQSLIPIQRMPSAFPA